MVSKLVVVMVNKVVGQYRRYSDYHDGEWHGRETRYIQTYRTGGSYNPSEIPHSAVSDAGTRNYRHSLDRGYGSVPVYCYAEPTGTRYSLCERFKGYLSCYTTYDQTVDR